MVVSGMAVGEKTETTKGKIISPYKAQTNKQPLKPKVVKTDQDGWTTVGKKKSPKTASKATQDVVDNTINGITETEDTWGDIAKVGRNLTLLEQEYVL